MSSTAEPLRQPPPFFMVAAGRRLAREITAALPLEDADLVLEVGPGHGYTTEALLARMPSHARLVALEPDALHAYQLLSRYDGRESRVEVVHDVPSALPRHAHDADVIVATLSWTLFCREERQDTVAAMASALAPTGVFTTVMRLHSAWTPQARRLAREMAQTFAVVERGPVLRTMLPPCFVYRATLLPPGPLSLPQPGAAHDADGPYPASGPPSDAPFTGAAGFTGPGTHSEHPGSAGCDEAVPSP